jgi:hypothetical protein
MGIETWEAYSIAEIRERYRFLFKEPRETCCRSRGTEESQKERQQGRVDASAVCAESDSAKIGPSQGLGSVGGPRLTRASGPFCQLSRRATPRPSGKFLHPRTIGIQA